MARSVDDVNESIAAANSTINTQGALISGYTAEIEQNSNEAEALRRQKDVLENTQIEIDDLCRSLAENAKSIGETYGANNGFASGFSQKASEKITDVQNNTIGKLQSMIERLQDKIDTCEINISNAQSNLYTAQTALNNAQNDLSSYKTELIEAEEEAAAAFESDF
ncbi:MAG: hypothetical protein NC548_54915 [Lachnospiraceae bacterium]|nr:hypothetical protein [Lachnospiraceae bacterium]MCM1230908.1 hypothetical protein [Ruminococcus flavefaciens]